MYTLYMLGTHQYGAISDIKPYCGYWDDNDFMTFSPLCQYIHPGPYGSYISTATSLNDYASHIVDLHSMESANFTPDMIQLLYLAVIFDFMAFVAQTFRRTLGTRPSTPDNLRAIRAVMSDNIHTMDAHFDVVEFSPPCLIRMIAVSDHTLMVLPSLLH
jgi:hypothetical protein